MTMVSKIVSTFRDFGIVAGLLYGVDRVLATMSPQARLHFYEMMVQPIGEHPLLKRSTPQFDIRPIGPDAAELALMPIRPEVLQRRLAQQATCLGAFKKGALVGYMWFRRERYEEDEVRCTYVLEQADAVFDFDFYLFPEHRMGMAFAALWNGANAELHRQGVRCTFSRMTRYNLPSRRAHRHLGARRVGRLLFLQLGQFEVLLATLAPYMHASTRRRVRVCLGVVADA